MLKRFKDLTEKEILALAVTSEEEDGRIYGAFADALRESYPATAEMFEEMRREESGHRDRLLAMFKQRFGDHMPPIRREDVRGFLQRRPVWMMSPLGVKVARRQAEVMEMEASRFYSRAAGLTTDVPTRELLNMLADEERKHQRAAGEYEEKHLTETARSQEEESHHRLFVLQFVQPGLAGSWMAPFPPLRRCLPQLSPRTKVGTRSSSVWPPASALASPWASPNRSPMMARSPAAALLGFAARSPA